MSYLTPAELAGIIANPATVETAYVNNWKRFARDLAGVDQNMRLGAAILPVAFAAIVAFDLKPYGPEPNKFDLPALLAAPSLACDDYVRLAWSLTRLMPQVSWAPVKIAALGWQGGAVGNHCQMMVSDGSNTLLLDPTVGIVVRTTYDDLLRTPLPLGWIARFWKFNSTRSIGYFEAEVYGALMLNQYRPSDALYFADSLERFNTLPASSSWPTPGAAGFQFRSTQVSFGNYTSDPHPGTGGGVSSTGGGDGSGSWIRGFPGENSFRPTYGGGGGGKP